MPTSPRPASFLSAGTLALATVLLAAPASAQSFDLERVAQFAFVEPVAATAPPGDPDRLFVVSNPGTIHIIRDGVTLPTPFLDISADVAKIGEGGLLGLAFHPDYDTNGHFYVSYTTDGPGGSGNGDSIISRYTVSSTDPDLADPTSRVDVFGPVLQPEDQIHRAGDLHFGPDGLLYFSLGDGGPSGNTSGNAQDTTDPRGSILRFDVDRPFPHVAAGNPFAGPDPGADHIWAFGLRNPFRFSIDPANGDLFIADVGQSTWEEIDHLPAGTPAPANFGWRCKEGPQCTGLGDCDCGDPGLTDPIYAYANGFGPGEDGCAVIGGRVYRGQAIPALQGRYLFADLCKTWIRSFRVENGQAVDLVDHTDGIEFFPSDGALSFPVAFGEDGQGELYVLDYSRDEVYKLVPKAWQDLGGALAGSLGEPSLTGSGPLTGGSQVTVSLGDVPPAAPAALVIGFSQAGLPLLGGTLVPTPDVVVTGLQTGPDGIDVNVTWPASFPQPQVYLQYWLLDAGAVAGVSASNALLGTQR